ncbi:S1C family serine protease [Actinomyces massiliensis]|uniref:S1C family serine protease n=1 Tax=Actinomyces massiliensis TaxID=461393 RepID=UPI0002FF0E4D|nr:trypsin-like peptidase domain-containing protein [Actinomyces massiliensis]
MSTYDEDSGAAPWQGSGGSQAPRTSRTPQAPQTWHDAEAAEATEGPTTSRFSAPGPERSSAGAGEAAGTWGARGAAGAQWGADDSSDSSTADHRAGSSNSPYREVSSSSPYREAPPNSPYTAAPQTPAGYSFARSSSAPAAGPGMPGGAPGDQSPSYPIAAPPMPASVASAASAGSNDRRRGPGWGGVIVTSAVVALLACAGTASGLHYFGAGSPMTASTAAPTAIATGSTTQTVSSTGTAPDWEAVTAAVSNAVVSITVEQGQGTAVGSGVVYDSSGHIVTNNHVVGGASRIQVTLADGRIYNANLTGTDSATDLAVIALENPPSDLTVAQIGDSAGLVTGQDVMAIGNPLGLSSTATTGIISALDRPVVTTQEEGEPSDGSSGNNQRDPNRRLAPDDKKSSQVFTNAIQIDAAINPGNSGGPLFDETGTVIGITSSIASTGSSSSEQAGSIGIGFAIPSNLAKKVADQLISTGTATHAYIGVTIGNGGGTAGGVTRAGAEVGSVESGSPAEAAGLKEGDVITAIDGKPTREGSALTGFVRQYSADDQVTLTVIRDGEELQTPVTLSERKDT